MLCVFMVPANPTHHLCLTVDFRAYERDIRRQTSRVNEKAGERIIRICQNRIYTPYMTVYLVISLPKILYLHHVYMVLPTLRIICALDMDVLKTRVD